MIYLFHGFYWVHTIERRSKTVLVTLGLRDVVLHGCPGNQEQGGIFTRRILRALRDHLGADDSEIELYYDALISDLKTPEDIFGRAILCLV